jgi:hypothetical protein
MVSIHSLGSLGADYTDFIIITTEFAARLDDGTDMEFGCGRLTAQLAQLLRKHFLQIMGQAILFTKEDNATLSTNACNSGLR